MKQRVLLLLLVFLTISTLLSSSNGVEVVIMEHSADFPRVANPIITSLPDGRLLCVFSFITCLNDSDLGIWGKYSSDGGSSWSDRFLVKSSTTVYQAYPRCLGLVNNGVALFYLRFVKSIVDDDANCSVWMMNSFDSGETWADDKQIDGGLHNYTLGTCNIVNMRNGTLVYPVSWFLDFAGTGFSRWASSVLRSDDNGDTWYEGGRIPNWEDSASGLDEPAAVELENGSLYCILRTSNRLHPRHACSLSNDYGLTWTQAIPVGEMIAIDTSPAIVRYSWSPNVVIAAWINRTGPDFFPRTPLVVGFSIDNCLTWENVVVVDESSSKSMNDLSFCIFNEIVSIAYRRYNYPYLANNMSDDAVARTFTFYSADFNKNGAVDIFDAIRFANTFDSVDEITDLNRDGFVDIYDALSLSRDFGKTIQD